MAGLIKFWTIIAHHSNYRQINLWMNTKINVTQRLDLAIFKILAFRNDLKSTKNFRFPILSKCVKDKLKQDALLPLPHGYFFLLALLKVRFGGKWILFFIPIGRFSKEQNCVQKSVSKQMHFIFSELKLHEFALKFDLIFNVFQFCQNALLKT